MLDFTISLSRQQKSLLQISQSAFEDVYKVIEKTAVKVQNTARKKVKDGPKTGRIYRRGSVTHQASAPGQPPATDKGTLLSRITHNILLNRSGAEIGTDLKYGFFLEDGTKDMKARPFLVPALKENQRYFVNSVVKALKDRFNS